MSTKKTVTASTRFQKSYSRNTNDWDVVETAGGRMAFVANGAGVQRRLGMVVTFLKANPGTTARALGAHLRSIHSSYSLADVAQPLKRLVQAGLVQTTGKGFQRTYTLIPQTTASTVRKAAKKSTKK